MEAMSGGEIRTDEPAALDVSLRLLLTGERIAGLNCSHLSHSQAWLHRKSKECEQSGTASHRLVLPF